MPSGSSSSATLPLFYKSTTSSSSPSSAAFTYPYSSTLFGSGGGGLGAYRSAKYRRGGLAAIAVRYVQAIVSDPRTRNVFFFLLLNLSFTVVEFLYGWWTNSLGLTSDAVHMLFDSTALIFSLLASVIAKWESNQYFNYGYGRVETLTGFANALALVFASVGIVWEGLERLLDPPDLNMDNLLTVSILGLLVNIVGIFAFDHGGMGHSHDHGHGHGGHSHGGIGHDHHAHGPPSGHDDHDHHDHDHDGHDHDHDHDHGHGHGHSIAKSSSSGFAANPLLH
ncbi:hypothetical protein HK405_006639, partial [Cladochytrium tenue]